MIYYSKIRPNYKYRLEQDYKIKTAIRGVKITAAYYSLAEDGWLVIKKGYRWDGPSGPTIDWKCSLAASLVHDVLYQMLRESQLPYHYRGYANELFYTILIEKKMWCPWAKIWYEAVDHGAKFAAKPVKVKILTAP